MPISPSSRTLPNPTSVSRRWGPQASHDERRRVVAQWRVSGLTIRAFARRIGMYPSTLSTWIRRYVMELSADGEVADESPAVGGFIPAVPPSVVQVASGTGQDAGSTDDGHLSWQLPADLGVVQGTVDSLSPLLMTMLRGLRS